jgi:hypothetical protein
LRAQNKMPVNSVISFENEMFIEEFSGYWLLYQLPTPERKAAELLADMTASVNKNIYSDIHGILISKDGKLTYE